MGILFVHTRTHSRTRAKSRTLKIASISAYKAQRSTKEMIFGGDVGSCHSKTKNFRRATSDTPQKLVNLCPWTEGCGLVIEKQGQIKFVVGAGCQRKEICLILMIPVHTGILGAMLGFAAM